MSLDSNLKNKDKDKKKIPSNKKRMANVVQTKGVFSEGLAPGKVKAFGNAYAERLYSEKQVLDKPKLNLNKKIQKTEEDTKLKLILKDDFIDDSCQIPDITFIPNCLPMIFNGKLKIAFNFSSEQFLVLFVFKCMLNLIFLKSTISAIKVITYYYIHFKLLLLSQCKRLCYK